MAEKPCPNCGHCPTCGHTPQPVKVSPWPYPYPVYPQPYAQPYQWWYSSPNACGVTTTTANVTVDKKAVAEAISRRLNDSLVRY